MTEPHSEPSPEALAAFRGPLLEWYRTDHRQLPWRHSSNPYNILLSEVILQQTRVEQGLPYYERFVDRFPDLQSLADAELDEVLRLWEGLGYYARARNLHATARLVREEHGGYLPEDHDRLRALPGVGPYTAAAVGSIAFGLKRAAVDGNVMRVLARVFLIEDDVRKGAGRKQVESLAGQLLDPADPATFNQAIMELGAVVCTPVAPLCDTCPLRGVCGAAASDGQSSYPFRSPAAPRPHRDIGVGVLEDDSGHFLVRQRPPEGLLGGLWEFPGENVAEEEEPAGAVRRALESCVGHEVHLGEEIARIDHAFSHFTITLVVFQAMLAGAKPPGELSGTLRWAGPDELKELAFSRPYRKLIEQIGV
jgi:A/G-specific adenine glycosylase